MRAVIAASLVFLLASCSFVDGDKAASETVERPDIILSEVKYTLGQSKENPIFIESSEMSFFSSDNRATTASLTFIQRDDDGNVSITGSADSADINTSTKVMELSGNVILEKLDDNMMIQADQLTFDSENSEIIANGDVYVRTKDGTFSGTGFAGDLKMDIYAFSTISEGVFDI